MIFFNLFSNSSRKKLFYKQNVLLLTSWGELLFTNETDDGTADFLPTTFYTCASDVLRCRADT